MEGPEIADLLRPFVGVALSAGQLRDISIYIDILTRWNQQVNLTSVRQPEEIVTRHFGESLWAASQLFPHPRRRAKPAAFSTEIGTATARVVDVGSGAGFPGLPIKMWAPQISLTLIESNHKKATFLREIGRALKLASFDVFAGRIEVFPKSSATVVTLRAVERFESILPWASGLVVAGGRLALLIGESQFRQATQLVPQFEWRDPLQIPLSHARVLAIGTAQKSA